MSSFLPGRASKSLLFYLLLLDAFSDSEYCEYPYKLTSKLETPTGGRGAVGVADQVPAPPPGPGRGGAGHLHIHSAAAANQQQFQVGFCTHAFIVFVSKGDLFILGNV